MTGIIDYDAGNLKSVEKALNFLNEETIITRDKDLLLSADRVILPGVGAFGEAMEKIRHYGLESIIHSIISKRTPFLGICLGQQLIFEGSEESDGIKGLGLLKGYYSKIPKSEGLKIPQIGWNSLNIKSKSTLFEGITNHSYVYFVHSYYLKTEEEFLIAASTEYGVTIPASIEKDNIFACQFHPEKSSQIGLQILRNFITINREVYVNAD